MHSASRLVVKWLVLPWLRAILCFPARYVKGVVHIFSRSDRDPLRREQEIWQSEPRVSPRDRGAAAPTAAPIPMERRKFLRELIVPLSLENLQK